MLLLLFVLLILAPYSVLLRCIFYVPGSGIRTLEAGVGTLVSVGMTVVNDQTIPWSGRTTSGSLSVCHTPEVFQLPPFSESIFKRRWFSNRDEINYAWADASSDESCAMVSIKVATVALFVAVDVARLARASTVSAW